MNRNTVIRRIITIALCLLIGVSSTLQAQFSFIENKGQWHKKVEFRADLPGGVVFLEEDALRFVLYDTEKIKSLHDRSSVDSTLNCHAFQIRLTGASPNVVIKGSGKQGIPHHYFKGKDPAKWASNARSFSRVLYENIYPGIDFEVLSYQYKLKYNFYVKEGADPNQISLRYNGLNDLLPDGEALQLFTSIDTVIEEAPFTYYQDSHDKIESRYRLNGTEVGFEFPEKPNSGKAFVIDPTLVFSTFSGSLADNFGYTATFDKDGNAYSGGTVYSIGFPVTLGAFQLSWKGGVEVDNNIGDLERDIGILKYSPDGTKLLYATHIGGSHNEDPHSMIVNDEGDLLIFGNTGSSDFPVTAFAYDTSYNGRYDIFVARLSEDGSQMVGCTYLGGSGRDGLNGRQRVLSNGQWENTVEIGFNYGDIYRGEIITGENDKIYICSSTSSTDFPTDSNRTQLYSLNGQQDAVVAIFSANLDSLLNTVLLGGKEDEAGYALALDSRNNVYACGGSNSQDLSFKGICYQDSFQGAISDGVIFKLSPDLDSLMKGTFIGTARYDNCYFIQLDEKDEVYITGQTIDTLFPVKNVNWFEKDGKQFICKLPNGLDSLIYSSKFGSGRFFPDLAPSAFLVDQCGRVYFSGWGGAANFNGRTQNLSTTSDAVLSSSDGSDFYLAVFSENIDTLLYGSYFGGDTSAEHVDGGTSRYSRSAIVYQSVCGGCGGFSDFPTTAGVVSRRNRALTGNNCNNALFKLDFDAPVLYADFIVSDPICRDLTMRVEDRSENALRYHWNFGDGDTSSQANPTHTYSDTGTYTVQLIVYNILSCPGTDTFTRQVKVYDDGLADFDLRPNDCGNLYFFKLNTDLWTRLSWQFGDGSFGNSERPTHLYQDSGTYQVRLIVDSGTTCADTLDRSLHVPGTYPDFEFFTDSCSLVYHFDDDSKPVFNREWEFIPGQFSTLEDPDFTFPDTGSYDVILRINKGKSCYDSVIKTVNVRPVQRQANYSLTIDSCDFSIELINQSPEAKTIEWFFGNRRYTGDTLQVSLPGAGIYDSIKMRTDFWSFCPDSSYVSFELDPLPVARFSSMLDSCNSVISLNNNSLNSSSFRWELDGSSYRQRNIQHQFRDTGQYQLLLIANPFSECSDSTVDTVNVNYVHYADFVLLIDSCELELAFENTSVNGKTFLWMVNGDTSSKEKPDEKALIQGDNLITLIIEPGEGCADTATQLVSIPELANANFYTEREFCNAYVSFIDSSENAVRGIWRIGSNQLTGMRIDSLFEDTAGLIATRIVFNSAGCPDSISKSLSIDSIAKPTLQFELDSCINELSFQSAGASFNPLIWELEGERISEMKSGSMVIEDGAYNLSLTIYSGTPCERRTDTFFNAQISALEELKIPNIISPNGDGYNDRLELTSGVANCDDFKLLIFNRWGVKVHQSEGDHHVWQALNNNGIELSTGVYYYIVEYNGKKRQGTITVVR